MENVLRDEVISLNFQNYSSMEKCDVSWGDVTCSLNFFKLVFNRERLCVMRWCGMLIGFLELFFIGEMWHDKRWFFKFFKLFFYGERWCGIRCRAVPMKSGALCKLLARGLNFKIFMLLQNIKTWTQFIFSNLICGRHGLNVESKFFHKTNPCTDQLSNLLRTTKMALPAVCYMPFNLFSFCAFHRQIHIL
jgi:hypothetical protein